MLESLRDFVGAHTEAMTDGQFFGFGIIALGVAALAIWMLVQVVRNRTEEN